MIRIEEGLISVIIVIFCARSNAANKTAVKPTIKLNNYTIQVAIKANTARPTPMI
jgi:hypothetical protein